MGKFRFERSEDMKIPGTELKKGEPSPNVREFDSSPSRAISFILGHNESTIKLVPIVAETTEDVEMFEVWSAQLQGATTLRHTGTLRSWTTKKLWEMRK